MRVALLNPEQYESMIDTLFELHTYYNANSTVTREVVRNHLLQNLLAADSGIRLVVATRDDGVVLGFAAISLVHSLVEPAPEMSRQLVLRELFVRSSERSQGIGTALMVSVARYAVEHGCFRIDWPVKASNSRGISFYERLGAERFSERLSYRILGDNLTGLARQTLT